MSRSRRELKTSDAGQPRVRGICRDQHPEEATSHRFTGGGSSSLMRETPSLSLRLSVLCSTARSMSVPT
jgi:hypothetical protein